MGEAALVHQPAVAVHAEVPAQREGGELLLLTHRDRARRRGVWKKHKQSLGKDLDIRRERRLRVFLLAKPAPEGCDIAKFAFQ